MKNLLRLLPLGALSLLASLTPAAAQMGSNPFARIYAAPSNPQPPAATPNPGLGAAQQNPYGAAGMNQMPMPAYSSEPIDPNHKLGNGDQLSFAVVEDRGEPNQVLTVNASGDVLVPNIGLVPAAGKTVAQFSSEVKARLERDYYYHATVMMGLTATAARQSRGRVYVTGAVHMIGAVDLPVDEKLTVSKAIIKAGGPKDVANLRKVRVMNKDGAYRGSFVDFKDILAGKYKTDLTLEPGDTVVVPERSVVF